MDGITTVVDDIERAEASFGVGHNSGDISGGVEKSPPPAQGFARPTMSLDKMLEKFLAIRDKMDEIKKRHKDELNPYALVLGSLEGWLLDALNQNGLNSMRAAQGTFFKTTRTSAKVVSWSTTLDFIKEKEAWELLEARVSKTAAEAIVAETQQDIPGVTISRESVLNVRRA